MLISSDFRDFYDFAASGTGPVLLRDSKGGPPRRQQFKILEEAGFLTPPHGAVGDVLGSRWEQEKQEVRCVVAYTDEMAHCTEGKKLIQKWQLKSNPHMGMPGGDRFWKERQLYCSAFVGDFTKPGVSLRRLQLGRHVFWLEYTSEASWMSNCGEGSCEVIGVELDAGYHAAIRLPLFAIDFVIGCEMYAVDFNVAPGVRGTGVEQVLSVWDVCDALEGALVDLGEPG